MTDHEKLKAVFLSDIELFKQLCKGQNISTRQILEIANDAIKELLNSFEWSSDGAINCLTLGFQCISFILTPLEGGRLIIAVGGGKINMISTMHENWDNIATLDSFIAELSYKLITI